MSALPPAAETVARLLGRMMPPQPGSLLAGAWVARTVAAWAAEVADEAALRDLVERLAPFDPAGVDALEMNTTRKRAT